MEETLGVIKVLVVTHGINILVALVIFFVGRWVAKKISVLLAKAMGKTNQEPTLVKFVENLSYIGLMALVIIAAIQKMGIPTTSFVAVLGAAGLAVGLALQGSLSNFAAGVLMMIFKPYKIGDYVEVGGTAGTVKEIQIFNTILASPDNVKIIVPNAKASGDNIKNYSANGTRRVDMVIGVSYDDDLKKAHEVIKSIVEADDRVLQEPETVIAVSELADSSVNFVVRPWTTAANYWGVYFDLTEKIKVALDANGITIPYPQRDVHLIQK